MKPFILSLITMQFFLFPLHDRKCEGSTCMRGGPGIVLVNNSSVIMRGIQINDPDDLNNYNNIYINLAPGKSKNLGVFHFGQNQQVTVRMMSKVGSVKFSYQDSNGVNHLVECNDSPEDQHGVYFFEVPFDGVGEIITASDIGCN